jgi:hypothetical protein
MQKAQTCRDPAANHSGIAADPDGKGSLSTFQALAFPLVVVALISFSPAGRHADISGSILTLLGISGIDATIAKGTESQPSLSRPAAALNFGSSDWRPEMAVLRRTVDGRRAGPGCLNMFSVSPRPSIRVAF